MAEQYIGLAVIVTFALVVGLALPLISRLVGPYKPKINLKKLVPYESGMDPVGTGRDRFAVKFYMVAIFFIIFDLEVIFMYPWAIQFTELTGELGWIPFVSMFVFTSSLFLGLIYIIRLRGLEWS